MTYDGGVDGAVLTKDETRILSWSFDNPAPVGHRDQPADRTGHET